MADCNGSTKTFTHAELCQIARRWLLFPHSRGGHGCQVAFVETRVGSLSGEIPDAIGFRVNEWLNGSVVVECKASRADFLADRKKPHRQSAGMGRWRYFACPEGMIGVDELPPRWGLLVVGARGTIRAVAGAAAVLPKHSKQKTWPDVASEMAKFELENDHGREALLLANLLHRVGDAEALNRRLREADAVVHRQNRVIEKHRGEVERLRTQLCAAMSESAAGVSP
ncbi:MAG: hypothetical protein ACREPQ_14765 [Rhodanobacter sp.]